MHSAVTQLILKIQCLKSQPSTLNRVKPRGELHQVTSLLAFKCCFGNLARELLTWCWWCCSSGWRVQWEGCASCLCSVLCPMAQLCEAYSPLPAFCSVPLPYLVGNSSFLGGTFCLQISHLCNVASAMFWQLFDSSVELAPSNVAMVRKAPCRASKPGCIR